MNLTVKDAGQGVSRLPCLFFGQALLEDNAPRKPAVLHQVANTIAGMR